MPHDRFTTAATLAVEQANEQAHALGKNDPGPQHLLLGIIHAGGVASYLLEVQGVTHTRMLAEINAGIEPMPIAPILESAAALADERKHQQIGTDHILLTLLNTEGPHQLLLDRLGADKQQLIEEITVRMDAVRPENLCAGDLDQLFGTQEG